MQSFDKVWLLDYHSDKNGISHVRLILQISILTDIDSIYRSVSTIQQLLLIKLIGAVLVTKHITKGG